MMNFYADLVCTRMVAISKFQLSVSFPVEGVFSGWAFIG